MTPKLVLFDIDGTLLLIRGAGMRAINTTIQSLFNRPTITSRVKPDGKTDPLIIQAVMGENGIDPALFHERKKEILETYVTFLKHEVTVAREAFLMPGIPGLPQKLRSIPGCYVGIVTGNFREAAHIKMSRMGIQDLFAFGGYADDSHDRHHIVLTAIKRARSMCHQPFQNNHVYVIGDTPFDIAAANTAGVTSVGVATGSFTEQDLRNAGCDYVFTNLGDVDGVLSTLNMHGSH